MVLINSVGILTFALILLSTVCCNANIFDDMDGKSSDITEVKRPAFYAGSRYGRSQYGSGASSNLHVAPRRDFHFLRYGKRTETSDTVKPPTVQCYESERDYVLTCSFTGVQDYYRCWKGQERKSIPLEKYLSNTDEKEVAIN